MKTLIAAIIGLSTIGFGTAQAGEALLGFHIDETGLTFQVASNGCTKKSDFELLQRETWPVQVDLVRQTPDICEMNVPYGTTIHYSFAEIGMRPGTELVIANGLAKLKVAEGL